ncbi:hypothetical protein NKH09_06045 [Mesorhizobium sp. M1339]|uniref:hypothetical protein n=1 Tax=unclassified Mesorhizobium TaxID=325217 RepID=UPI0033378728
MAEDGKELRDRLGRAIEHLDREWVKADRLLVIAANARRELSYVPLFQQRHAGNYARHALNALANNRHSNALSAVYEAVQSCERSQFDSVQGLVAYLNTSVDRAVSTYSSERLEKLNPQFGEFVATVKHFVELAKNKRPPDPADLALMPEHDELENVDAIDRLVKYSTELKLPPKTLAGRKFTRWIMSLTMVTSTAVALLAVYALAIAGSFRDLSIYAQFALVTLGLMTAVLAFLFRVVAKDD